jgi:hypothetical protein
LSSSTALAVASSSPASAAVSSLMWVVGIDASFYDATGWRTR